MLATVKARWFDYMDACRDDWSVWRIRNEAEEHTLGRWGNEKGVGTFVQKCSSEFFLYFALDQKVKMEDLEKMILAHPFYLPGTFL